MLHRFVFQLLGHYAAGPVAHGPVYAVAICEAER
jgi:hypothetical protein